MADLQQQIQAILGNPEAMGQITALAGALTGTPPADPPQTVEPPPSDGPDPSGGGSFDPASILSSLGGGTLPGMDSAMLDTAMTLLAEYNAPDDEKTALLAALKPYLNPKRVQKLEAAERAARLSRVARTALRLWRDGGGPSV